MHYKLSDDIRALKRVQDVDRRLAWPMADGPARGAHLGARERLAFARALPRSSGPMATRLVSAASECDGVLKGLRHPQWPAEFRDRAGAACMVMMLQALKARGRAGQAVAAHLTAHGGLPGRRIEEIPCRPTLLCFAFTHRHLPRLPAAPARGARRIRAHRGCRTASIMRQQRGHGPRGGGLAVAVAAASAWPTTTRSSARPRRVRCSRCAGRRRRRLLRAQRRLLRPCSIRSSTRAACWSGPERRLHRPGDGRCPGAAAAGRRSARGSRRHRWPSRGRRAFSQRRPVAFFAACRLGMKRPADAGRQRRACATRPASSRSELHVDQCVRCR